MRASLRLFTILLSGVATCLIVSGALAQTSSPSPPADKACPDHACWAQYQASYEAAPLSASYSPAAPGVTPTPQTPCAQAHASAAPCPGVGADEEEKLNKVEHLRRAAEHLAAAEKVELAEQAAREALVEEKLEQIRKLQAEVAELRQTTSAEQPLAVHVKIMELRLSRMRKLGIDLMTSEMTVKPVGIDGFISGLRQYDLVRILAEPTLVTVSGRPATFHSGGEFPIVVQESLGDEAVVYREFGTRLDCVAQVLDNGKVRLELRPTVSEIDASRSVTVQNMSIPGLRTRWVDTAVEMEIGQTLVLSGVMEKQLNGADDSDESEDTTLLVTATVDLVEAAVQAAKSREVDRR